MTSRLWLSVAVTLALAAAWMLAARGNAPAALRSEHARPAGEISGRVVLVTAAGKLYHREGCSFVHGPATRLTDGEAVAGGYTPCTRCLPR